MNIQLHFVARDPERVVAAGASQKSAAPQPHARTIRTLVLATGFACFGALCPATLGAAWAQSGPTTLVAGTPGGKSTVIMDAGPANPKACWSPYRICVSSNAEFFNKGSCRRESAKLPAGCE